jgi:Xaa-Pro aminopeptidase
MERRDLLKGLAAGAAGALVVPKPAEANWGMIAPGQSPAADFDGRLPLNKPRAYEVMDREGVDGLVALNPVNVFYLGNYFSYELQKLRAIPSFAVFPRDESQPSFLVVASTDLMHLANGDREYPEIIPYSAPSNWQAYLNPDNWDKEPLAVGGRRSLADWGEDGAGKAGMPPGPELTAREQNWVSMNQRHGKRAATPEWALVRALEESGLAKARVAVDDMRIADILKNLGRTDVTCVPGDNTFRKIRMIKSEVELKHMQTVAQVNQAAAMATLQQIDLGATKDDIDRIFMLEAAKRGAKAMWIAAGTVGGLPNGEVVKGQPMMIDAVCQVNFYHGDFGRTFVLGEPSDETVARTNTLKTGWAVARDVIRPGMKYSELRKICGDAMAKVNPAPDGVIFGAGPHSVGLQHTDQPYRDGLPFVVWDDLTFEENMTLTVDFPAHEMGWGGAHLEDLVVVTKNGVEPLATVDEALVVG